MKEKEVLPLKRRLLYRSCAGVGTLTIGFVLFLLAGEYIYIVPFALMAAVFFVDAGIVAYAIAKRNFVRISGTCTEVIRTKLLRRVKEIRMNAGEYDLSIIVRRRVRGIELGKPMVLFLSKGLRLYEKDGAYIVCSYLALSEATDKNIG